MTDGDAKGLPGDEERKLQFNLGDESNAAFMASSQDLAKALIRPQVVEWIQLVEPYENKPGQEIEAFIESIDNVAEMVGWGDAEKLVCCRMKIKGAALTVLRAHPHMKTCKTWNEFVDFLYKNFKTYKSRASSFDKFFNTAQRHNETVREFATRLRLAGSGTVADGPRTENTVRAKVLEENMLAVFLKGMKPGIQRFVLSRSPRNFDQAVRYAEEEAQNESLANAKSYAQVVEERTASREPSRAAQKPPEGKENRRCYTCSEVGHLARFCPNHSKPRPVDYRRKERERRGVELCQNCGRNNHPTEACRIPVCEFCLKLGHTQEKCYQRRDLNPEGLRQGPNADRPGK